MDKILKQIIKFFEKLSSKPKIGGLQITDSAIQYVLLGGSPIINFALRLPPGVLRQGRVIDSDEFLRILKEFHSLILPDRSSDVVRAMVSLPAELVYVQSFSVPNISEEKLEEASRLNLQMISPIPVRDAYMSYQVVAETQDHYDLLGAFSEKVIVDQYKTLLKAAGFSPVIFEFPALALARLLKETIGVTKESVLVLQISSDGLDLIIYLNNSLYFDYFRSWRSIQGEEREISKIMFEEVVTDEVQKVINFSLARFKETPKQTFLITPGFESEIKDLLEKRFELNAVPLSLRDYPLGPGWYATLGSAIRGSGDPSRDNFIALGIEGFANVFVEERIFNFIGLWRNILASVLGTFFIVFIVTAMFLASQEKILAGRLTNLTGQTSQKELQDLGAKATEFNGLVKSVADIKVNAQPWHLFFNKLDAVAREFRVTIDQFVIDSIASPIQVFARAPDHETVIKFKNVLASTPEFTGVDLPLSSISVLPDNSVTFGINFQFKSQ